MFELSDGRILKLLFAEFADLADEEAGVLQLLAGSGVPAPGLAERIDVDGRSGIVLEGLSAGRTLFDEMRARPWRLAAAARELAALHARIHACTCPRLPALRARLEAEIAGGSCLPAALRHAALSVLHALPDGDAVCHNDLHSRNVIIAEGRPVVIDWARAARGDPLADVAVTFLQFQFGERRASLVIQAGLHLARMAFCRVYVEHYRRLRPFADRQLRDWLIPVTAAYAERRAGTKRTQFLAFLERQVDSRSRDGVIAAESAVPSEVPR